MSESLRILQERIPVLLPGATVSLDPTVLPNGNYWLDIYFNNQVLKIEYRSCTGYGVYLSADDSFGAGPDEIYENIDSLLGRIKTLK